MAGHCLRRQKGSIRSGDAQTARSWVAYCNDPANAERRSRGFDHPRHRQYWQIGNETSYARDGLGLETAATKTGQFATAMHKADPSIQLIGWGDSG